MEIRFSYVTFILLSQVKIKSGLKITQKMIPQDNIIIEIKGTLHILKL